MATIHEVSLILEQYAPLSLAEDWDNVGLLVGHRDRQVERIMTCLTVTSASVAEAVSRQADLVVAHHPLPFQPLQRLTGDTTAGLLLLQLIEAGVAVYSPHTAFDSAQAGINQQLAEGLQLQQVLPIVPHDLVSHDLVPNESALGAGRFGLLGNVCTLAEFANSVKTFLSLPVVRVVGEDSNPVSKVGLACGSGGSLLAAAKLQGCDCLVTGETSFHTCLEAEATGVSLVLTGHFASERFAVETMANHLAEQLPDLEVWASNQEADPLRYL